MASVIRLNFNMQEEDILELTSGKCHLYTTINSWTIVEHSRWRSKDIFGNPFMLLRLYVLPIHALFEGICLEMYNHDYLSHRCYYVDFIMYVRLLWNSRPSGRSSWALDACVVWASSAFLSFRGYGQRNSNVDVAFVVFFFWCGQQNFKVPHMIYNLYKLWQYDTCYFKKNIGIHGYY